MNAQERTEKIARLRDVIEEAYILSAELELGNIFYNEGFAEFFLSQDLGETWNMKTQGPDGFTPEGLPTEYKMRSGPHGSFQFHWLSDNKLSRIKEIEWVYFATRERTKFSEIWRIEMYKILPALHEARTSNGGGHRSFSLAELVALGAVQVR